MATWPPPAFWKTLSISPSGGFGSCSRRAARRTIPATELLTARPFQASWQAGAVHPRLAWFSSMGSRSLLRKPVSTFRAHALGWSRSKLGTAHDPFPRHQPADRNHGRAAHSQNRLPLGLGAGFRNHRALHARGGV